MNLQFREFDNSADYSKWRDLFQSSFPENSDTSVNTNEHYDWKFNKFPHTTPSYQYIAKDDVDLLGYYAALPYPYKIGNKTLLCGMVCDVMTHPNARGKGIFTKIGHFATADLSKKGVDFTTGYPIRPEVIPGHMKVGWKKVLKLPMYIRILRSKSFLPSQFKFLRFLIDPFLLILNIAFKVFKSPYKTEIFGRSIFSNTSPEIGLFLSEWLAEQENALVKTQDFLSWRTSAPTTRYDVLVSRAAKDNKIIGLAIVRPTILKNVEVLAILDVMILKNHYAASTAIMDKLSKHARQLGKDALVCMSTTAWAKKYNFLKCFFVPTPAVFTLIIKNLNQSVSDSSLFDPLKWHLFWIDSDDL